MFLQSALAAAAAGAITLGQWRERLPLSRAADDSHQTPSLPSRSCDNSQHLGAQPVGDSSW
jgi:hypothetical protein